MGKDQYDIIIAGGGVMGCAIATYLLQADCQLDLLLIERDLTYENSSTVLSEGNTRIQFNLPANIAMSQYGLEILENFSKRMAIDTHVPAIDFRQQGNLYLVDKAADADARIGYETQRRLGCDIEWLTAVQAKEKFPPLDSTHIIAATFGAQDGTMSPLAVLDAYRHKAVALGATLFEANINALLKEADQICGVQLSTGERYEAPIVINAAGAWAAKLAQTVNVELPIEPIKRQVYSIKTDLHFDHILPLLLLPNGQYVIHEGGGHFVVGGTRADDPITEDDFSWSKSRFEAYLWEGLVAYLPTFDRLKLVGGWAGLYAVNRLDGNAILGQWPTVRGLYLANGFSGHGFQQCHAVGRYIAELILGQTPTLDLSLFSPQRILENDPIYENPSRLI